MKLIKPTRLMMGTAALGFSLLIGHAATAVHDLTADFSLEANPTGTGWQYSESVGNGGGPVGAVSQNWNQGDFGAGQPGWLGAAAGAHAGWAKRVDNGNDTPNYDDPVGTVQTHGATSVLWKAPANDPHRYARIDGGLWNIRDFGRSGAWRIYKNSTILTSGTIDDNKGDSTTPYSLTNGSGGENALKDIPYVPGDFFRLEILEGDFVAVNFTITTTDVGPDPDIATQPQGGLFSEGGSTTLSVTAVGTAPFTYQWQRNGQDILQATSSSLTLSNLREDQSGAYTVVVANSKGSKTSLPAVVIVDAVAPETAGLHDLSGDFTFMGNPTSRGWTYSEALAAGGGPVGALQNNWNELTFGPGQPGYAGVKVGPFAGWAQRVNNGTIDAFDAPVGTVLTHGPTSVKYTVQPAETFKFANITGSLWSAERNPRGQGWKIWKNDNILLAEGVIAGGTSEAPGVFETSPGSENLQGIPITPGDTFRLEILPTSGPGSATPPYGDFVGVKFTIRTTNEGPDPAIGSNPVSQVVAEGGNVTLSVVPVGTAPFSFQWQFEGAAIAGATNDTLSLSGVTLTQAGNYTVMVSNSKGSKTSIPAKITVTPRPVDVRGTRYDLANDFSLEANPTAKGWQYSQGWAGGVLPGTPVGPRIANWNQPDFGPGQPGWEGPPGAVYAGWAKRVANFPNGAPGDVYDAPVGTILTHGITSALWTAPADVRPGSVADISGGLWNIRHLNRSQTWRIYRNDSEILTEGQVTDASGNSAVPLNFISGSGSAAALKNIAIQPGDSFRLEVGAFPGTSDFTGVNFTIVVRQVHSAEAEFDTEANPSPSGWQYSESVANGGGPVGAFTQNWNQPDFGAGQPGWLGAQAGGHAGWAKRIDNGNPTATFDDPVGTIMTHGPTSLLWKAPANDPGGLASLSGGLWNLRHLGRSGAWRVYKNSTVLTEGTVDDTSGSSGSPLSLSRGNAGDVLNDIPYRAGDEFRLEVLQGDFVGVKFNVSTYASGIIDPEITSHPRSVAVLAGGNATFSVTATGSTPVTYQWQVGNTNIPGATGPTLTLRNVTAAQAGEYKVIVTSPAGSATSSVAALTVLVVPGDVRAQEAAGDGLVVLEAEHFNQKVAAGGTDWVLATTPAGFSGEGAMLASPDAGRNVNIDTSAGPRMDYKVHFNRAGTYHVWVRGLGDSAPGPSASDSVNVGMNNSLPDSSDRITGFPQDTGYTWSKTTLDGPPATLVVPDAGPHVINVWMREDGQIIDKLLLTLNANSTFTDVGPAESALQGETGPELDISRSGGNITITWAGGGTLQSSPALPGNWGDVQGGSPYQTEITGQAMFFRVRR